MAKRKTDHKNRIIAIVVYSGMNATTIPLSRISTICTNNKYGGPLGVSIYTTSGGVIHYHHNIVGQDEDQVDDILRYYQSLAAHAPDAAVINTPEDDEEPAIGWVGCLYMCAGGSRELANSVIYIESVTNFSIDGIYS